MFVLGMVLFMEITNAVEVGKLFLLWLNLRLLADSLSILEDGYNSVLSYLTGWAIDQES